MNKTLLVEMGKSLDVDVSQLLDNREFVFCSTVAKPLPSFHERMTFTIRVSNFDYENAFVNMRKFLVKQLMMSPIIIDKFYDVAYQIFKDNHFITFPISMIGVSKYTKNDVPYVQLYITNNPDTTSCNVSYICKETVLKNTLKIIRTMNLNIDIDIINEFINFAYSKSAFLCFYGIDFYIDKIKKFKLYFRFKSIMSFYDIWNLFGKKINALNDISIQNIDSVVDFVAFSFIPTEKKEFLFDGIQIYQR